MRMIFGNWILSSAVRGSISVMNSVHKFSCGVYRGVESYTMFKIFALTPLIIEVMWAMQQSYVSSSTGNFMLAPRRRIIGGYMTDITWVPYFIYVSLRDDNILRTCGGSIISRRWVLTAAHCLYRQKRRIPNDSILLYAGTSKSIDLDDTVQMRHVTFSTVHRKWKNSNTDHIANNDIAILKTCTALEFNDMAQPIRLPPKNYELPDGVEALACGFGDTRTYGPAARSDDLYAVLLRKRRCWGESPAQTILCFEGAHSTISGICHGDSGGPLMYLDVDSTVPVLIGVASGTGCKRNIGGGSFTEVSRYRDWIREVTGV